MSRTNRKEVRVQIVGARRKEPDVRRIAKAIIRLSLESDEEVNDRLADLAHEERAVARRRRASTVAEPPEGKAS
jgi:hypothetical protein